MRQYIATVLKLVHVSCIGILVAHSEHTSTDSSAIIEILKVHDIKIIMIHRKIIAKSIV